MLNRTRWGDNDCNFGPFIYARDRAGYRPFSFILQSGDDEYPGCSLRFSGFGHTFITALPPIIQPWRKKVFPVCWDADTVARLGRNWYYDMHRREYGVSLSRSGCIGDAWGLYVSFGPQTHDSRTTKSLCRFLPWTQWRHVRHSHYDIDGAHFWTEPEGKRWSDCREEREKCPTRTFAFVDFDGESLTAKTRIEEREWRFGAGWFEWLSWFRRPMIQRSLDIHFSGETGERKGSWKGGTIGHSIEMLYGETHEAAFRRYCDKHKMTFIEEASA